MDGAANNRPVRIMRFVKVYPENGEPYWKDGKEPAAKEIGATALHGIEYADFRKEYRAHWDKYSEDGEANKRYAEEVLQQSRYDFADIPREKKAIVNGI